MGVILPHIIYIMWKDRVVLASGKVFLGTAHPFSAFLSSVWCQDACLQLRPHPPRFQNAREGVSAWSHWQCPVFIPEPGTVVGKCEAFCYELNCDPFHPCNSYVEALTLNVVAFRDGGLWEIVKFR